MLVLPSDHRIDDNKELFKSINDLTPAKLVLYVQ